MPEEKDVHNRILCVDADETSRILLRRILEAEGFVVTECADGAQALDRAPRDKPDLIIMSLQMPDMDGFETLERMRGMPELGEVPALALTGRRVQEDRDRVVKAGYGGCLSKPIQRLVLIEEIDRLLSPAESVSGDLAEGVPSMDDDLRGKTVLLVDDNPVNLQIGEKILTSSGMAVLRAVDGKDALKILESGDEVDVILSDILMPGMDGYQFCRMVKTTGAFLQIPFLFYTSTHVDNTDIHFGLDLGAERYIVRPLPARRLLEILKEVLRDRKGWGDARPPGSQDAFMADEVQYYREYNARLVSKLEQNLLEIKNAYRTLETRNEELSSLSGALEERVKKRTRELEEANRNLKELDRQKTGFLNKLAHDLRTPMTSIRSYAELLLKYKDEPEETREEFLQTIIQESVRLSDLLNAYLERAEDGSGE